ncbi:hypothetical protein Asppvi_008451 [Aspergillus pseudoviridinutans]|uniref:DNA/RNA-binding domain-containing protein n=1 Tax=Aspergillus pseudoviridinutans TaxID=1517512 RepID=A0A9P3BG29_9EURO|nr:uncharacterized protein Asppvi_008451 [Aspergillus pseudoviridinutans]GIJ89509.1 hypothetical protein Asppvi_008451 [Aspergillus pseudoviridinutans]
MEADEDDPPRRYFERSIRDEKTESEPPTVDSDPPLAYPAHSETSAPSIRAVQDGDPGLFKQEEPNHIKEEQLINEVRGIYTGLVMVEKKCIEIDKQQTESKAELSESQWQALISLHRALLYEHHDFFLASQCPSATQVLKRLARKYALPARMWRYGIHSFLELLRRKLPEPLDHMLNFIYLAYSMMTSLFESVSEFRETWIECLGDLGRYRMAVEETDMKDREVWARVSRYWYNQDADRSPKVGRMQHHLAVLARPDVLQQLFYYTKALVCRQNMRQETHILPEEQIMRGLEFLDSSSSSKNLRLTYQKRGTDGKQELELESAFSNDRIFEIPCQLAEHSTNALGDYGAKKNFMKEEYALRLGLPISRNTSCKVTIGSGKQVTTVGTVTVPFMFSGENEVHNLEFQLLPNCIHNVIIGKPFLKLTKTFSNVANFCHRVKERVAKGISQFHLLYLGASTPMFEGSINGRVQTALADSGSKVLLMDEAYARSIGVHIQTGHEHQTRLKFADNSATDTVGIAYNVKWRFGRDGEFSSPYPLNFHILKDAPANVVLSDTFLFDTKAFSQYHQYLTDNDDDREDEDMLTYFFAIDVDKRKKQTQMNATSFSLADLRYLELVRRGEEADRISTLPGAKGTAARNIEDERCAEWDRAFTAVQTKSQPQSLQLPSAAAVSQAELDLKKADGEARRDVRIVRPVWNAFSHGPCNQEYSSLEI